jgi:lipopolysaccharide export system permease protein
MFAIIFLISIVEMFRRSFVANMAVIDLIKINFIKIPIIIDQIFPYTIFIATVYTIEKITNNKELVAINGFGVSFFVTNLPMVVVTFFASILYIAIFQPIAANANIIYNQMKNNETDKRIITFSENGIWLKDKLPNGSTIFLNADYFYDIGKYLADVKIYEYTPDQKSFTVYLSDNASMVENDLVLSHVTIIKNDSIKPEYKKHYKITTNISSDDIFAILSPKFFSIWNIKDFIKTLKKSGFSIRAHEFYFYNLLFWPLFNMSVVLIAMALCLFRFKNKSQQIVYYLTTALIIYFIRNLSYNMASSNGLEYYVPLFLLPLTMSTFASAILLEKE